MIIIRSGAAQLCVQLNPLPMQHYSRSHDNTEQIRTLLYAVINKLKYDESYNFVNEVSFLVGKALFLCTAGCLVAACV